MSGGDKDPGMVAVAPPTTTISTGATDTTTATPTPAGNPEPGPANAVDLDLAPQFLPAGSILHDARMKPEFLFDWFAGALSTQVLAPPEE